MSISVDPSSNGTDNDKEYEDPQKCSSPNVPPTVGGDP